MKTNNCEHLYFAFVHRFSFYKIMKNSVAVIVPIKTQFAVGKCWELREKIEKKLRSAGYKSDGHDSGNYEFSIFLNDVEDFENLFRILIQLVPKFAVVFNEA